MDALDGFAEQRRYRQNGNLIDSLISRDRDGIGGEAGGPPWEASMKMTATAAAIEKWLATPPQPDIKGEARAYLAERTKQAYAAKDYVRLPTLKEIATGIGRDKSRVTQVLIQEAGGVSVSIGRKKRWALVEE